MEMNSEMKAAVKVKGQIHSLSSLLNGGQYLAWYYSPKRPV